MVSFHPRRGGASLIRVEICSQKSSVTRKIDQSSLANLDVYRDEIADVLVDVLLHSVAPIDAGADLAEHLVPGAPELRAQIASQRRQILVEAAISIARAHAEPHRSVKIVAQSSGGRVTVFAAARPLHDHFVHIFAHCPTPEKQKPPARMLAEG